MKFLIVTCNKTKHILHAFNYQFEKYIPDGEFEREFIDLEDEPVKTWTQNVYKRVKDITDEFVVFSLDDYLIIDKFNKPLFEEGINYMKNDHTVVRYELGRSAENKKDLRFKLPYKDNLIIEYYPTTPYRISCQISVWRTEYLLKFLSQDWSIWDFEVQGSKMSDNDGMSIICTKQKYALRWIEESALSMRHPNRINLYGMRLGDVHDLIDTGRIDGDKVQFGMAKGGKYVVGMMNVLNIGDKYKEFYV